MMLKKIDESGRYTYFPGVTVVSGVREVDLSFWKEIYKCIADCELSRSYYSPLPFDSYHMTTTNLFTKQVHGGSNWARFLRDNQSFFQRLNEALTAVHEFSPQITIEGIIISSTNIGIRSV